MSVEAEIQSDIDDLRERFPETQDIYREAAAILFFRYGITPTANKLYQYVRKGSMSAPSKALAGFWSELREKSRVRIEYPDIPENIKNKVSEFVGALWETAQSAAQDGLAAEREEAQVAVQEAEAALAEAEQRNRASTQTLAELREELAALEGRIRAMDSALEFERAAKAELERQLAAVQAQRKTLDDALVEARRDFSLELGKLREDLARSEERFAESEKRALLEIDRERLAAARAQKDLAQLRTDLARDHQDFRGEITQLQAQLGEARQVRGSLEGAAEVLRIQMERQAQDLQDARKEASQREVRLAVVVNELASAQARIVALESNEKDTKTKKAKPKTPRGKATAAPQQ